MDKSNFKLDVDKLETLKNIISDKFEDIVLDLGIDLNYNGYEWRGICPVHGGDNNTAILLFTEGNSCPGYWRCHTRGCQKYFNSTLIGFIQGCLSHQKHNWTSSDDQKVSFYHTVMWICKCLGLEFNKLNKDYKATNDAKFRSIIKILNPELNKVNLIKQSDFVSRLKIPSSYFIDREFSPNTLKHFMVGDSVKNGKRLSGRAIVPILNENGDALGFSGRSVYDVCNKCGLYHEIGQCPPKEFGRFYTKWVHSKGFRANSILYNWPPIKVKSKPKIIVLTEGPADVWRLWEAGINCGVAMLGDDLSDNQQVILETGGISGVIVATDNDSAGKIAADTISKKLERSFWVERWTPSGKDVGDTPIDIIQDEINPLIEKIEKKL